MRLPYANSITIGIILVFLFALMLNTSLAENPGAPTLKIMTLNLHNGKDTDNQRNFTRFAELVAAEQPDIIALQEVQKKDLKYLNLPGYHSIAGPNANYAFFRFGNALLTRHPIVYHRHHYLPSQKEQRGVDEVAIEIKGQYLRVLNTHIGLGRDEQQRQIDEISRISRYLPGPLLITGDFNLEPSHQLLTGFNFNEVSSGLAAYKTFPAKQPKYHLDQIWYNDHWQPVDARPVAWHGSDHLPVLAVLALKTAATVPAEPVAIPDPTLRHNPLLPDVGDHPFQTVLTFGRNNSDNHWAGFVATPLYNGFHLNAGYNGNDPELAISYLKTIDLRDYYSLAGMRGKAEWDFSAATAFQGKPWLEWRQYYRWSDRWGSRILLATGGPRPDWGWEQYYLPVGKLRLMAGVNADSDFIAGVAVTPGKRQVVEVQYIESQSGKHGNEYRINWEYRFQ